MREDHPRIRGEHSPALMPRAGLSGSSPHTRGAPTKLQQTLYVPRIIPAYAGSTPPSARGRRRRMDHPRIRGEHWSHRFRRAQLRGSSPHTRGAPPSTETLSNGRRIIPAYAGSTSPSCPPSLRPSDHPRIRGEHQIHLNSTGDIRGSSPHTRGAPVAWTGNDVRERIIPAYAGSTPA